MKYIFKKKYCAQIVGIIALAFLFCLIPWKHKIDNTVLAFKLDKNGNEIGEVQVHMSGIMRDSILGRSELDVTFSIADVQMPIHADTSKFRKRIGEDFLSRHFAVANTSVDPTYEGNHAGSLEHLQDTAMLFNLACSEDFDQWCIYVQKDEGEEYRYMFSIKDMKTVQELKMYFLSEY